MSYVPPTPPQPVPRALWLEGEVHRADPGSVVSFLPHQALQPQLSPLPHSMSLNVFWHWASHYSLNKKSHLGTPHLCKCRFLSLEYAPPSSHLENSCSKLQSLWEAHNCHRQSGAVALPLAPTEIRDVWFHLSISLSRLFTESRAMSLSTGLYHMALGLTCSLPPINYFVDLMNK